MKEQEGIQLYEAWMRAWNGDPSVLEDMTAPDCRVHQARSDGKSSADSAGVEALKAVISDGLAFFEEVRVEAEAGPVVQDPYIAARWTFTGIYAGGLPGAKAEKGKKVAFGGMDLFRVENGRIKEYWVSSDGIHLMQQLGAL